MNPLRADVPKVPGLTVEEEIGRGAQGTVFRASRDGKAYAVKVHHVARQRTETGSDDLRFRREAAALARLSHPSLIRIFDVGEFDHRPFLVMELAEGRPLSELLARGPLEERVVINIGRAVAGALAQVSRCGLVHRDVKPKNILVDASGGAKLIDFGFVTDSRAKDPTGEVVATLRYAAPEQVGSLQRPVDGRSDLYALGVVLFECLTGRAPFLADNIGDLLRMHAVEKPPDARALNPAVSPRLSAIVARCLAKDPDDRYPDGESLAADLVGDGTARSLGDVVGPGRDEEESIFVGRSAEMTALRTRWLRASDSRRGGFFLIAGESGTGKSRLARELIREAREAGALVLGAKSSQGDAIPFACLRNAVDGYLAEVYSSPEELRTVALERIRAAAGEFRPLLKRFSPRLATALSDEESVDHIGTQEQFLNALATFLVRLTGAPGGGVVLFDDVQWMDDGSRTVVARLAVELENLPVLVLCTARSEAENIPAVDRFTAEVALPEGDRLQVLPLGRDEVKKLICAFLGTTDVDPALVDTIFVRSVGVPFAVSQFLRSMLDAGVLRPSWGRWVADREGVEHLDLPSDVIHLVVKRIDGLDESTKEILTLAAVLGSRFSLTALPKIAGHPVERVQRAIGEGRRSALLEAADGDLFSFVHDRIREALLSRLDPDALRMVHQRCADALESIAGDEPQQIFALAFHAAQGEFERHLARVFKSNWRAGRTATEQFAYEEAYGFLATALRAAREASIEVSPELQFLCGDVCARTSRLPEAVSHLGAALKGSTDPLVRSQTHLALARVYSASPESGTAWDEIEKAFIEVGERPPRENALALTSSLLQWGLGLAAQWSGIGRGSAGEERKRHLAHFIEMSDLAGYVAYIRMSEQLLMQTVVRGLLPAHQLGPSREAIAAYASYAVVLGVMQDRGAVDRYLAQAKAMSEQLGDRAMLAVTEFYRTFAAAFCGDIKGAAEIGERCRAQHSQWLDGGKYMNLHGHTQHCLLVQGYMREAWELTERGLLSYARRNPHLYSHYFIAGGGAAILSVLGRAEEAATYFARAGEENEATASDTFHWSTNLMYSVLYHLGQGDYGPVTQQYFDRWDRFAFVPSKLVYHVRFFFALKGLVRLEQLVAAPVAERGPFVAQLAAVVRELAKVANVPIYRGFLHLLRGALHHYQGRSDLARDELRRAADIADAVDGPWLSFEVSKQRARILLDEGKRAAALREAEPARALAYSHGWLAWEQRLVQEFQLADRSASSSPISQSSSVNTASVQAIRMRRRLDALLQVSLASSSALDLDAQARATLDELVRVLNAERGLLFLASETTGGLRLLAGRDAHGTDLPSDVRYSASVIHRVHATGAPCVFTGREDGELVASESTVALGLRSMIAAPLRLRDRKIGVVYLDSRLAKGVFTSDDVDILTAIANHISISLETARASRLEIERQALEKDLAVTAAVQSLLLPKHDIHTSSSVRLAGFYRPATNSGGDWWWYEDRGDELRVLVGDVSGHGAGSAMVTAAVASAFNTLKQVGRADDLPDALAAINQTLRSLCGERYHMTLCALTFEPRSRRLVLRNAGAPPVLILRSGGKLEGLAAAGTPLGTETFDLGVVERELAPGDRLVVFTDGLLESLSPQGKELGLRGIKAFLTASLGKPVEEARETLAAGLLAHAGGRPLDDDVAFVVLDAQ